MEAKQINVFHCNSRTCNVHIKRNIDLGLPRPVTRVTTLLALRRAGLARPILLNIEAPHHTFGRHSQCFQAEGSGPIKSFHRRPATHWLSDLVPQERYAFIGRINGFRRKAHPRGCKAAHAHLHTYKRSEYRIASDWLLLMESCIVLIGTTKDRSVRSPKSDESSPHRALADRRNLNA